MILTKELFEKGLKSGKYIGKAQCLLFGIPFVNNKKQKKELIGKEISKEIYCRFLELKVKPKTRISKEKANKLKKTILKPDIKIKPLELEKIQDFVKGNKIIEDEINKMRYSDFLKTQYWRSITKHLKGKAGNKCELCGAENNLQVHHKTYLHHGKEIFFLDDLCVLCDKCHHQEHIKNPDLRINTKRN